MALLSDNFDIEVAYFRIDMGNDGDYYPEITYINEKGLTRNANIRVAMSGGNAPSEVKLAIANLWQTMEKYDLNVRPNDEPNRWPLDLPDLTIK